MRDSSLWSVNLGAWGGVQVRLHASFLLFALVTLFLSAHAGDSTMVGYGLLSLVVLLVSVALHEMGHCSMALRLGGQVDEIVLGPLGGLAPVHVPANHIGQLLTALSGPTVNLLIVVLTAAPLLAMRDGWAVLGLLNPVKPQSVLIGTYGVVALKLTFWVNWVLVVANLLPAPPLDGARMLRAMLAPMFGYRRAVLSVALVAQLTAIALLVVAWMLRGSNVTFDGPPNAAAPGPVVPLWAPLVLLATILFFSAKVEIEKLRQRQFGEDLMGLDLAQGFGAFESPPPTRPREPGAVRRWLDRRRQARIRRQRILEEEEDWRVDDILARLHDFGPHSLSAEDRILLERASARYRSRMGKES
jgi:Zn-dependent protease